MSTAQPASVGSSSGDDEGLACCLGEAGALYTMYALAWMSLATIPLAAIGLLILIVAVIVHRRRRKTA